MVGSAAISLCKHWLISPVAGGSTKCNLTCLHLHLESLSPYHWGSDRASKSTSKKRRNMNKDSAKYFMIGQREREEAEMKNS
jgi:hypothetical protein